MAFTFTTQFIDSPLGKTLVVTDTTDYYPIGPIDILDVSCTIDCTFSDGTTTTAFYTGDVALFDIVPNTSRTSINTINLPLDADGEILLGQYTVTVNYFDNTIIPPDPFPNGSPQRTYNFQCPCPEPEFQITVDCGNSTVKVEDVTDYGSNATITARVLKVYPPPVLNLPPYTTSAESITVSGIFTKTWTAEVITDVTYTFPDGSTLLKQIVGVQEFDVECDNDICKILCCISNLKKTYERLECKNPTAAQTFFDDKLKPLLLASTLYQMYSRCGDSTKAAELLADIKNITGCTDDCAGCNADDDSPIEIIPSTASDSVTVVDSPNNSIAITSTTVGSTTTYHLQVSSAIQNLLTTIRNVTVTTSTPSYLAIVTTTGGINVNYAVNWVGTIPAPVQRFQARIEIILNTNGVTFDYFRIDPTVIANIGAAFQPSGSVQWKLGQNIPNVFNDIATIEIKNFLITPATPYIVHAQVMNSTYSNLPNGISQIACEVQWHDPGSDDVILRLIDPVTGQPWRLFELESLSRNGYVSISLSIYSQ